MTFASNPPADRPASRSASRLKPSVGCLGRVDTHPTASPGRYERHPAHRLIPGRLIADSNTPQNLGLTASSQIRTGVKNGVRLKTVTHSH